MNNDPGLGQQSLAQGEFPSPKATQYPGKGIIPQKEPADEDEHHKCSTGEDQEGFMVFFLLSGPGQKKKFVPQDHHRQHAAVLFTE